MTVLRRATTGLAFAASITGYAPAHAASEFPFGLEMTLEARPQPESKKIPTLEIGDNKFVTPNHNGTQVFLDTDALAALREMSDAIGANDVPRITAATQRLRNAHSSVQALIGTQGARINEMEDALVNIENTEFDLKAFRSDLRDTEVDKAMVELVGKQTLYQAAMSATSRILGLSLANYL